LTQGQAAEGGIHQKADAGFVDRVFAALAATDAFVRALGMRGRMLVFG
jgi:hypothetical protein